MPLSQLLLTIKEKKADGRSVLHSFQLNQLKSLLGIFSGLYNDLSEKPDLNLKADLVNGSVPASQLPSYVDDVIEGYLFEGKFYSDLNHTEESEISPESNKIYINLEDNLSYRWSGSMYVEVSKSLALGETESTAFSGSRGKALEIKMAAIENRNSPVITTLTDEKITVDYSTMDGAVVILDEAPQSSFNIEFINTKLFKPIYLYVAEPSTSYTINNIPANSLNELVAGFKNATFRIIPTFDNYLAIEIISFEEIEP